LVFFRDDHRVDDRAGTPHKLDVAAFLAGFRKTGGLQSALDLPEGQGTKPPQPRPQSCGSPALAWPAAARNEAPAPLSNWPRPLVRSPPDSRHRPRGTGKHTSSPRAKPSQQTVAS